MTGGMDNPVGLAFTPEGDRVTVGDTTVTASPAEAS